MLDLQIKSITKEARGEDIQHSASRTASVYEIHHRFLWGRNNQLIVTVFNGCYLQQLPQELGINVGLVTLTFLKASFKDKRYVENKLQWSASWQLRRQKSTHTTSVLLVGHQKRTTPKTCYATLMIMWLGMWLLYGFQCSILTCVYNRLEFGRILETGAPPGR